MDRTILKRTPSRATDVVKTSFNFADLAAGATEKEEGFFFFFSQRGKRGRKVDAGEAEYKRPRFYRGIALLAAARAFTSVFRLCLRKIQRKEFAFQGRKRL